MNDSQSFNDLPIEIDVASVKSLLDQQIDFLLVDCREQNERDTCHIEGSLLIPMNETPNRVAELESYRDRRIVIHCHGGVRSFQVASWLRSQGFSQTQSMVGGIDSWSQEIDKSIPRY